jgi:menaquinone-dependent protoporphyrinogen IX oxidase
MKILIACYSYTGNTLKVARHLQKELDAELTEIETVKDKWYLFKIWDALRGNIVPIKPCITDLSNYDAVIICSPVWAGRTPAAVNEYLSLIKHAKDKSFAVLVTAGGNRKENATVYIREYLTKEGMNFLGQIRILADEVKKKSYQDKLDLFSKKFKM